MPPRRLGGKCRHGHDVAVGSPNRYESPSGKVVCRACQAAAVRRHRKRHGTKGKKKITDRCSCCGRPKFRDRRALCLSCRFDRRAHAPSESYFADAVALETAPAWVVRDPKERAKWLAQRRVDPRRLS